MPFKAKAQARHHIPAQKYRATNWPEDEGSLKQRGNLLIWFNEEMIAQWQAKPRTTPGGQAAYSSLAILTGLALRAVFHTALRQTEGLLTSILALLELSLSVPDRTTLRRRGSTLVVPKLPRAQAGNAPIIGGPKTRKSWRKLPIGTNAKTGEIVAHVLTTKEVDDASQVAPLLDQIDEPVAAFLGDGTYDTQGVIAALTERHPHVEILLPPRATAVLSVYAQNTATQRAQHLLEIAHYGRSGWQKRSGYTIRSRVENSIGRSNFVRCATIKN